MYPLTRDQKTYSIKLTPITQAIAKKVSGGLFLELTKTYELSIVDKGGPHEKI